MPHTGDGELTLIAPSSAFAAVPTGDLRQDIPSYLGVAGIMGRLPAVAEALGSLTAAMRTSGTLRPGSSNWSGCASRFSTNVEAAFAVRYQSAIDDGLDENAVCSLEKPAEAENLSAAERLRPYASPTCSPPTIPPSMTRSMTNCASTSAKTSLWNSACTARLPWGRYASRRPGMSVMIFPTPTARPAVAPWDSASVVASG